MENNVTIIIFSRNRSLYLHRALKYYAQCQYPIIVADSSDIPEDENALRSIHANISYRYFESSISLHEKVLMAIRSVKTEFFILTADDDFTVPEGIHECARFLRDNPDYSSAQGYFVGFNEQEHNITFRAMYIEYQAVEYSEPTAAERFISLWSTYYDTVYCMMRTEPVRDYLEKIGLFGSEVINMEVAISSAVVIAGKTKKLPIFYCARREEGARNYSVTGLNELESDACDEEKKRNWHKLKSSLAEAIAAKDNISLQAAHDAVKCGVQNYVNQRPKSHIVRIKRALKSILMKCGGALLKPYFDRRRSAYNATRAAIMLKPGYPGGNAAGKAALEKIAEAIQSSR